jgi:hypothetical protein
MKLRIFTVPFLMVLIIATASAQYSRTDLVSNQPGLALAPSIAMTPPRNGAHNQLFFTAGPNTYANGLFGVITVGGP